MKIPYLLLIAAIAAAPYGRAAAQTSDQANSSVEIRALGEAMEARTVNRSFLFDSRLEWGGKEPTRLLLRLDVATTARDDAEGLAAADVSATAWKLSPGGKRERLWTLTEPGDTAQIVSEQPLLVVRQPGCCGARDSYAAFNLYSGRRLFSATGDSAVTCWMTVEVPNSGGMFRMVAVHSAYSSTDDVAFGGRKNVVALVTYAAPDKPLARFFLTQGSSDQSGGPMGIDTSGLIEDGKTEETDNLTLWSANEKTDPAAIGGFAIRLHIAADMTVSIPVRGDKLDIAAATLPAGLHLETAPLP